MTPEGDLSRMAEFLRSTRLERRLSLRVVADSARVNVSVVQRLERGIDARLKTWSRVFMGMGYLLTFDVCEAAEECEALLREEAQRRRERRYQGLLRSRGRPRRA